MQDSVQISAATMPTNLGNQEMHTILAIDPGKTTGYCLGCCIDNKLYLAPDEAQLSLGELDHVLVTLVHGVQSNLHIVYEDFNYRNVARMGLDLTPVKMIGIIELYMERYEPLITFTKQTPAVGKAFYTDEKLKELGIYKVGKQHGRDATRHLMQWANFGAGGQFIDVFRSMLELADVEWLLDTYYFGVRLWND